jgi:hypothetical protein
MAAWWQIAPSLLVACFKPEQQQSKAWYRLARGWLGLDCADDALSRRFQDIYPEGSATGPPPSETVQVTCRVCNHPALPLAGIAFDDPEPLDSFAFCRQLFPDRGYVEGPSAGDWRTIALQASPEQPLIALNENLALVDRQQVWQPFVANYAVNRVLRLQRDILFFHAASVAVDGQGILIVGPKGAGKTTTSLTLAARGWPFFGDEMAAVQRDTKALWPCRRAASLRSGPRAPRLDERLAGRHYSVEKFPDGGERILVDVGELLPEAEVSPAALSCVLFLRRFAERPKAELFAFGLRHFQMLSPLACSMWGASAGGVIMDVSRLLKGTKCYFLDPGSPEPTADLIEKIARGGV